MILATRLKPIRTRRCVAATACNDADTTFTEALWHSFGAVRNLDSKCPGVPGCNEPGVNDSTNPGEHDLQNATDTQLQRVAAWLQLHAMVPTRPLQNCIGIVSVNSESGCPMPRLKPKCDEYLTSVPEADLTLVGAPELQLHLARPLTRFLA